MKKQGIQISYGNIHSKDIKHFLKEEKRQRKKDDAYPPTVTSMLGDVVKQTSFLSLDPEHPIKPIDLDKTSLSSFKSVDNEQFETKSKSRYQQIKNKVKKTFKRKNKISDNTNVNDDDEHDEQTAINSDAASRTSTGDDLKKSNQSLDKV